MATLTRSMFGVGGSLLGRFWQGGSVQAHRSVRALRRKPVRVLYPGAGAFVGTKGQQNSPQKSAHLKSKGVKVDPVPRGRSDHPNTAGLSGGRPEAPRSKGQAAPGEFELNVDGLRYEKALPDDKRLGKVVTIARSKKFRERHGQILLEGQRLITDALDAGAVLQTLFFNTMDRLKELPVVKLKQVHLIKVKFEEIKMWSDLVTPQGLIGIFAHPDHSKISYPTSQLESSLPLTLICDNIRDPGNLGTILRSAAGAGCDKVLLTKGCVDAWEPKVLRAGMGAHFRIPVITSLDWDVLPNYLSGGTRVYVANNWSKNTVRKEASTSEKDTDNDVSTTHTGKKSASGKASEYGWVSTHPKRKGAHQDDYYSSGDESEDEKSVAVAKVSLPKLETLSYYEHWVHEPTAIVIGGETQGLSLESLLLAESTGGAMLLIPMVPGVESLNSAMAASIFLFEGKRQLQLKPKQESESKRLSV